MLFRKQTLPILSATTIALLSACGNIPQVTTDTPQHGFILTLDIAQTETQQALQARYGGEILAFDAAGGFAMLRVTTPPSTNDPSVRNVQSDAAITAPETTLGVGTTDPKLTPQGPNSGFGGWNAWSGGWSAWSSGWSAWSGGWSAWSGSTSITPELPAQNTSTWNQVKLFEAHRVSRKFGAGIKVAVIDTGLDTAHPMFSGRLAPSSEWKDFVDNDTTPQEASSGNGRGHGTGVAGIILQVAPRATILPIRVLGADGGGLTSNVVAGITHAVNMGAQIINVSVGTDGYDQSLLDICVWANSRGVLIVASAGNNGENNNMTSPGRFTWMPGTNALTLGVGSVKGNDQRSSFSAYGNHLWAYAPGEQIWSAFPGNQAANFSGTSFAAPIVAGAFALGYSEVPNAADRNKLEGAFWAGFDWPTNSKYVDTSGNWKGGRVNIENFIRRLPGWVEPTDVQPGVYNLVNVNSNKCVDVDGAYTNDGANVHQWACHGGVNQKWRIEKVGSNYRLTAVHSGKVLDVSGASQTDGANVQQWAYGGTNNQLWQFSKSGSGFRVVAVHSGKCLDVLNFGTGDGTNISQVGCNGGTAQQFFLRALF